MACVNNWAIMYEILFFVVTVHVFVCISVCFLTMVGLQQHGNIVTQNLYMRPICTSE